MKKEKKGQTVDFIVGGKRVRGSFLPTNDSTSTASKEGTQRLLLLTKRGIQSSLAKKKAN